MISLLLGINKQIGDHTWFSFWVSNKQHYLPIKAYETSFALDQAFLHIKSIDSHTIVVFICKQTCAADTDNGYVANGQTLSFDNKAPAKGDVFAAIAKSVFLGLASAKKMKS